jgi:hypothetical protein
VVSVQVPLHTTSLPGHALEVPELLVLLEVVSVVAEVEPLDPEAVLRPVLPELVFPEPEAVPLVPVTEPDPRPVLAAGLVAAVDPVVPLLTPENATRVEEDEEVDAVGAPGCLPPQAANAPTKATPQRTRAPRVRLVMEGPWLVSESRNNRS